MEGEGKFYFPDGRIYEGGMLKDAKHGYGTMIWPDGRKYQGFWKEGEMHGKGKFTEINGTTWLGIWQNGKLAKNNMIENQEAINSISESSRDFIEQ